MAPPTIEYFPVRSRAEAIKLSLAAAGIVFEFKEIDLKLNGASDAHYKTDLEKYPFGQVPRYDDGEVSLVQSSAILRYIAKKHGLSGANDKEAAIVDQILEGVESLRLKYVGLVNESLPTPDAEAGKAKYAATHIDPAGHKLGRIGGAHFLYFSALLKRSPTGWIAGTDKPTVADIATFDVIDLHRRHFAALIESFFPDLIAFHAKIAALPGIKEYLYGPQRLERATGNGLG